MDIMGQFLGKIYVINQLNTVTKISKNMGLLISNLTLLNDLINFISDCRIVNFIINSLLINFTLFETVCQKN